MTVIIAFERMVSAGGSVSDARRARRPVLLDPRKKMRYWWPMHCGRAAQRITEDFGR
jgi:hypothetical protein